MSLVFENCLPVANSLGNSYSALEAAQNVCSQDLEN